MKNFPLLHAILAFAFSPLGLTAAKAQQSATDAKVLHNVNAVLESEKAFRGLLIATKVSHGTVTLTGTVSSEGDKVLAGMEVGQVEGVRTVLNDLEVRSSTTTSANTPQGQMPALADPNGAQTQRLTNEPHTQPSQEIAAKIITIPVDSSIQVRLSDSITTKTAKTGDQFHGTLAAGVYADGAVAIPTGTPVLGRVVSAKPAGHFVSAAELALEITTIRLPQPDGKGQDVGIVTEYLSSNGKGRGSNTAAKAGGGAAAGAIIGALAGGGPGAAIGAASGGALGLGANAITSGGQIELKPEALLRFQTAAPLTTTIYEKNGVQIQLPGAPGPALKVRAINE
jgi:BON domain